MGEAPRPLGRRVAELVAGIILLSISAGLLSWCPTWWRHGDYEYVIFNGMIGLALGIIGIDYVRDAIA